MAERVFLERRTYRRNRLQDAARLLPVLGLMLIFAPIFIRDSDAVPIRGVGGAVGGAAGPGLSGWLIYYFVVWAGLIVITALVSRALVRTAPDTDAPGTDEGAP